MQAGVLSRLVLVQVETVVAASLLPVYLAGVWAVDLRLVVDFKPIKIKLRVIDVFLLLPIDSIIKCIEHSEDN